MRTHKYKPGDLVKVLPTQPNGYKNHVGKICRINSCGCSPGGFFDRDGEPFYRLESRDGWGYYREEFLILLKRK